MSLRRKTILYVSLTLVTLVVVTVLISYFFTQTQISNEIQRAVGRDIDAVLAVWDNEVEQLGRITEDWAMWDDTYAYIQTNTQTYIDSNISPDIIKNLGINLIIFVNSTGQIAYSSNYDLDTNEFIPLPEGIEAQLTPERLLCEQKNETHDGMLVLPQGPVLVTARPILPSQREGQVKGTLIFGRFINRSYLDNLSRMTDLSLDILRMDDPLLPDNVRSTLLKDPDHTRLLVSPVGRETTTGYVILDDLFGLPELVLEITVVNEFTHQAQLSLQTLLISLFAVGLVSLGITLGLIERLVLQRLAKMREQVNGIGIQGDLDTRIVVEGKDELAELGWVINHTLGALNQTQKALADSEEHFRELVENLGDMILVLSSDGLLEYGSPSIERVLGYLPEELIGRKGLDFCHPDETERMIETIELSLAHPGTHYVVEQQLRHKDGTWRFFETTVKSVYTQDRVLSLILNVHDITERRNADDVERRQRELAEALRETGSKLNATLDEDRVLDRLLDEMKRVLPYSTACVMYLKNGVARVVRTRGYGSFGGSDDAARRTTIDIQSSYYLGEMVEKLRPVIIADVREDPRWISYEASKHVRSWAGAPLIVGGQVIGILSLDHVESGFYRPIHAQSLAIFATQAAMALQNAQFYQAARSHAQENETLREAVAALTSALDLEHVLDSILTQLKRVVKHDSAAIFLVENDALRVVAGRGFINQDKVIGSTFPLENPLVLEAKRNHAPVAIADASVDMRYQGWGGTVTTRGWLGVPLMIRQEMIGFLTLDSTEPNTYGEAETSLAWTFAHQAAIAIDNARLFKQVHRMAIIDTLTGIYNRRHFFELASLEFERSRRYSHPLTMVMWDIDHFKVVNDTFGHVVGDRVLQMVAERSQKNLREVDILGRYGGEEFVAILGEADRVKGKEVAERLRLAIGERPFLVNDREISVTISIGIADLSDCSNLEILLDRADQALYQAKQGGRNLVCLSEEASHIFMIGE